MFDEMPDQFYQFLAATNNNTTTTSNNNNNNNVTNVPISFSTPNLVNFDDAYFIHQPQLPLPLPLPHSANEVKGDTVTSYVAVPWSNEEVVALVKIRSSMDSSWFSVDEFTWETVSRKLAEIGFKRSAQNCKDKFEQETKSFNNNNIIVNKNNIINHQNYRLFGELEELYNCNDDHSNLNNHRNDENEGHEAGAQDDGMDEEDNDDEQQCMEDRMNLGKKKKMKREKKFELFKGFCEKIVNKMIIQQEEFHCKIIEQMVKRDQENIVREIDWKKQEIDMINKELEVRAHEKAIVGDRQAKIFGFLKKFSSLNNLESDQFIGDILEDVEIKVPNNTISLSNSSCQNSISSLVTQQKCDLLLSKQELGYESANLIENSKLALPMSSSFDQASQNPNEHVTIATQSDLDRITLISNTDKVIATHHTSTDATGQHESVKDDIGRRWPRDEVITLINIKCNLLNNNSDHNEKESISKGPLWERISQKMMEFGYKRSSKRCKEKWENINKYFKKTKDLNKKRSIDSRTCPYFHQLSNFYNQGTPPHGQSDRVVNVGSIDNPSMALSGVHPGGSST